MLNNMLTGSDELLKLGLILTDKQLITLVAHATREEMEFLIDFSSSHDMSVFDIRKAFNLKREILAREEN